MLRSSAFSTSNKVLLGSPSDELEELGEGMYRSLDVKIIAEKTFSFALIYSIILINVQALMVVRILIE